MFKTLSHSLLLALALGIAAPRVAEAASFSKLAGKYTGVLILAQGTETRIAGNANVEVKANGLITITGVLNSVAFTQKIKLGPGKSASVSTLLPGIASFNQSLSGRYSGKNSVTVSGSFDSTAKGGEPTPGTLKVKIGKTTFGSTLSVETQLSFQSGSSPVYVTIVAS